MSDVPVRLREDPGAPERLRRDVAREIERITRKHSEDRGLQRFREALEASRKAEGLPSSTRPPVKTRTSRTWTQVLGRSALLVARCAGAAAVIWLAVRMHPTLGPGTSALEAPSSVEPLTQGMIYMERVDVERDEVEAPLESRWTTYLAEGSLLPGDHAPAQPPITCEPLAPTAIPGEASPWSASTSVACEGTETAIEGIAVENACLE
jgi:hypothetical protein